MALNPETEYPGRITASDANYPFGSSKNETAPGAGDGTPYEKNRADDVFGMQQALLNAAGITPDGNPDTVTTPQYLQAILHQALTGGFMQDGGGVDAYALTATGNNTLPPAYKDGQTVIFDPANANTGGAATLKIGTLAAKSLKINGIDPFAGALTPGEYFLAIYNLASDRFDGIPINTIIQATETQRGGAEVATKAEQEAASDDTKMVTPAKQQDHPSAAKAWVAFDGTGTVAIRDSYNVSSITDNGVGDYTVNFTTAFSTADYHASVNTKDVGQADHGYQHVSIAPTASAYRLTTIAVTVGATDRDYVHAAFHGDQ